MNMPVMSSSELKRKTLELHLLRANQTLKLCVDTSKLGDSSGFPDRIKIRYPDEMPLDIDPRWPLNLNFTNPDHFELELSFGGQACTCRIPYGSIRTMAVGVGDIRYEHEGPSSSLPVRTSATRPSYLQVVRIDTLKDGPDEG